MPISDSKPATAAEVMEQHDHAKGLYDVANRRSDQVVALMTAGVPIPKDKRDAATADVAVTQPVLAGAIVNRLRQMLQVEASMRKRVMPRRDGTEESKACSLIERWEDGYWRQTMYHLKRDPHRDALWWYLVRGVCRYEVRFRPDWLNTDRVPIETIVDDPATIFPVRGRGEILWYTKEYTMYARELRRQFKKLKASAPKRLKSTAFMVDFEDNDELTVVEYWDDKYYASVVEKENLVLSNEHNLGFVPLAEGQCMDTPMAAAEWAYQSVVGPVVEHIKQMYILASKMATGVNLFFYPLLYGVGPNSEAIIIDPNNPGTVAQTLAPGTELKVINVQVNAPMLAQLMAFFKSDINLATLPETAWGAEPQSLQSGFAYSQVMAQVTSAVQDKVPSFARAVGDHMGNVLRVAEKFGSATGANMEVPADFDE